MYVCGPTVYARAHIGNARPFVVGMWLRSWLRATGRRGDARAQHHRHQRQDLRRRAGRERRAGRARDRVVPGGHGRPRARHAGSPAEGDRKRPADRLLHRGADRERARLRGRRATSISASRRSPSTAGSRGSVPTRSRSRSRIRSRRTAATSRSGRRTSPRPRTPGGSPRGAAAGPAGTSSARRWPRRSTARRSRSTAAGSTSSSRTTRTRWRSRVRSATPSPRSGRTTGCCASPARRCRSRRERLDDPRDDRRVGAGGGARLLPDGFLAQADRLLARHDDPGGRPAGDAAECVHAARLGPRREPLGGLRGSAGRRFRHAGRARCPARLGLRWPAGAPAARVWRSSAWSRWRSATRRRRRSSSSPERRAEARAARDFEESDRLRDELAALGWSMRDRPDGFDLIRA